VFHTFLVFSTENLDDIFLPNFGWRQRTRRSYIAEELYMNTAVRSPDPAALP
jgi:hypothetical protein